MRADVKLGIVISLGLVTVAGGYYLYRDKNDVPIQLVAGPNTFAEQLPVNGKSPAASNAYSPKHSAGDKTATNRGTVPKKRKTLQSPGARNGKLAAKNNATASPKTGTPAMKQPGIASYKTPARDTAPQSDAALRAKRGPNNDVNPNRTLADATKTVTPGAGPRRQPARAGDQNRASVNRKPATSATPASLKIAVETHRAQPGDTLAAIAERYYGDPGLASFLAGANPNVRAGSNLTLGQTIKIPARPTGAVALAAKSSPPLAATRRIEKKRPTAEINRPAGKPKTYRVVAGDSFYKIAKTQLGNASRWKEIYELNKKLVHADPKRLQTGQLLVLPAG